MSYCGLLYLNHIQLKNIDFFSKKCNPPHHVSFASFSILKSKKAFKFFIPFLTSIYLIIEFSITMFKIFIISKTF